VPIIAPTERSFEVFAFTPDLLDGYWNSNIVFIWIGSPANEAGHK
jgi:hypothetical protein